MFQHVFVAGTFDGLHKGHEAVLRRAFSEGERVTIGLTSDEFVRKFKISLRPRSGRANLKFQIRNFIKRKRDLEEWLTKKQLISRARIVPIDDPCEPAASMTDLAALVITEQNRFRGEEINALRKARRLTPLVLLEVPLLSAEDLRSLSSRRMRAGEIDRQGRLVLPDALRPELRKPIGRVLTGGAIATSIAFHKDDFLITVGDVATKTLLENGITPTLSIVDGRVNRQPYPDVLSRLSTTKIHIVRVKSGPGYISGEAMQAIRGVKKRFPESELGFRESLLIIDGEEDLLTLPAITYAPLGSIVYYGQPGEGLVEVLVTEEKQREAKALLFKFTNLTNWTN